MSLPAIPESAMGTNTKGNIKPFALKRSTAPSANEVEQERIAASPVKQVPALGRPSSHAPDTHPSPVVSSPGLSPPVVTRQEQRQAAISAALRFAKPAKASKMAKAAAGEVTAEKKQGAKKQRQQARDRKYSLRDTGMGSPAPLEEISVVVDTTAAAHSPRRPRSPRSPPSPPDQVASFGCGNMFSCLEGLGSAYKTPDLEAGIGSGKDALTSHPVSDGGPSFEERLDAAAAAAEDAPKGGILGRIGSVIKKAVGGVVEAVKSGWRALGGLFRCRG